jgi:hypothetical protein
VLTVIVHLIDGTFELFRYFLSPAAAFDQSAPEELRAVRGVGASVLGMLEGAHPVPASGGREEPTVAGEPQRAGRRSAGLGVGVDEQLVARRLGPTPRPFPRW